ncbi:MAG: hypothetical protein KJ630_16845 [Proteobacteria bacterium]|nr:hypothetical protein [Pseudomonadota bacterium]
MGKTKTFRVENGRMFFKCDLCQNKRMVAVGPGVRTRVLRCIKCGESTRCVFNRRMTQRESQTGSVFLQTSDGSELTVDLYDISLKGVGFDLSSRDTNKITVGRDVQFKCTWNPRLLGSGRYIVRSVKDQRVGVERRAG